MSKYKIKFDSNFTEGSVITNDAEIGNLYKVIKVKSNIHTLEPNISGNKKDFTKGNRFFKIYHLIEIENGFEYSNIQPKESEQNIKKVI